MRRMIHPRYFVVASFVVLACASIFVYLEAKKLKQEFLRQTEDKGATLARAMATGVRNAIVGNALVESLIEQRLVQNARTIDQLLRSRRLDEALLQQLSAMNRLQKIDLLDRNGQPWDLAALLATIAKNDGEQFLPQREQVISYMWGRRWQMPGAKPESQATTLPPRIVGSNFWKGSDIGVAVYARSFPGIVAVRASADYVLIFQKEIGFQSRIQDLSRASQAEFIAFLDSKFNVVAHTDPGRIGQLEKETLALRAERERLPVSHVVEGSGGKRYLEVINPVVLDQSQLGFLKIGLALESMEFAWNESLRAIVILAIAIVSAGILGMAAVFHNQHLHLQEVKALEIEVLQRQRLSALGNMAATVAHEIRNPLNAISMGLQRLKAEFEPTDDHEDYTRLTALMLGEVHRLNAIVEQFLSLARPIEMKPEVFPLPQILRELAALEEADAKRSQVQIRVIAAPDMPPLRADPGHFTQVLLNLMLNGLQAMPDGGTLTLEANASNNRMIIAVTDTGTGMTAETQRRIFEPYFTTKEKGTGLGLAISRRIIEAHGGTITASNASSGGCRVEITLPIDPMEV